MAHKHPSPKTFMRNPLYYVSACIVICFVAIGAFYTVQHPTPATQNPSSNPISATNTETITTNSPNDKPSEVVPNNTYKWPGNSADPMQISIPSLSTEGYIQKVGIDANGQMAVPSNVHMAGWYVNSAVPGNRGLSIIDGHVDGYTTKQGIFHNLNELRVNDIITITFGSGVKKNFQVFSNMSVPLSASDSALFSQNPAIANQLNLITCTGLYDQAAKTYDQRAIISARLVP